MRIDNDILRKNFDNLVRYLHIPAYEMQKVNKTFHCSSSDLIQSHFYIIHRFLRIFFSTIALFLIPILTRNKQIFRRYHSNVQLILLTHTLSIVIASLGVIINSIIDVRAYYYITEFSDKNESRHPNAEKHETTAFDNSQLRLIPYFGNDLSLFTISGLAFERTWSTVNAKKYENAKGCWMGFLISSSCILASAASNVWIFIELGSSVYIYDIVVLTTMATIESFALASFSIVYIVNEKWSKNSHHFIASLSHKYQVAENVASVGVFIPLTVAHTLFVLSGYIVVPIKITLDPKQTLPNSYFDFAPLYYFLFTLIVLWSFYHKKSVRVENIANLRRHEENYDHFKQLNNIFQLKSLSK
ncbi:hypothetical protein AB6A40_000645 [Gnathostoma spinigerum]|uniref:Gustatory receptor n=1 Tax=Gnathostoma spinigerum TaxID=75299 RepID=A0ABD6E4K0_9BILA